MKVVFTVRTVVYGDIGGEIVLNAEKNDGGIAGAVLKIGYEFGKVPDLTPLDTITIEVPTKN